MYNRRKDYGISPTTPTCRERCPLRGGRRPPAGGAHVPPHPPRTDVVPQEKRGVGFAQLPLKGTLFVHRLALLYSVYTFQAPRDDAEVTGSIKHGECVRRVGPLVRRNGRQWLRGHEGVHPLDACRPSPLAVCDSIRDARKTSVDPLPSTFSLGFNIPCCAHSGGPLGCRWRGDPIMQFAQAHHNVGWRRAGRSVHGGRH